MWDFISSKTLILRYYEVAFYRPKKGPYNSIHGKHHVIEEEGQGNDLKA